MDINKIVFVNGRALRLCNLICILIFTLAHPAPCKAPIVLGLDFGARRNSITIESESNESVWLESKRFATICSRFGLVPIN